MNKPVQMTLNFFASSLCRTLARCLALVCLLLAGIHGHAQTSATPSVTPKMTYTNAEGQEVQETSYDGGAPLHVRFEATTKDLGNYTPLYEWQFTRENGTTPFLIRYEQATTYDFLESGNFRVRLLVSFVLNNDTVSYAQEDAFVLNIAESKLEFPNAFTPNGDGINDIFKAKEGYQSIVAFRADVVNRWGKRMAHWSHPAEGWDGKSGGSDAPEGAYYLTVTARGADGRKYNIKKTINLLRRYDAVAK